MRDDAFEALLRRRGEGLTPRCRVDGRRRREAKAAGAEAIVSCCPFCRDALGSEGENALPYLDMTVLLAERLKEEA